MEWADVYSAGVLLLAVFAAVLTLDKVNDLISKRHTQPMMQEIDFREKTEAKLAEGDSHMKRQDEAIDLLIKGQLQVMNHMAYGNHTDQLKATIEEYQSFLVDSREV